MQEILHMAYNEFVNNGNWETEHFMLILIKGGLRLKDKRTGKTYDLTAVTK